MYSKIKRLFSSCNFLIFIIILSGIFFYLDMNGEIFSNPKTIHFLRQTDCLSFAAQYFNDGFDFFNPKLYNLKNIDARAACEFPITYYIASLLYVIFGKHLVILKLVHLIILYIGIYYVYKLSNLILKSTIISILLSLFLFTSTVFNYYSFNYLPDTPALGLCFIGMYHIIKYFSNINFFTPYNLFYIRS